MNDELDNIIFSIKRFNNMYDQVELCSSIGIVQAKIVLNYGMNLLNLYKDTGVVSSVQIKVKELDEILNYRKD